MLLVLILMLKNLFAEARVFCQDINAMAWMPLGFSCPVTCGTIQMAVDKLKRADFEYAMQENNHNYMNMNESERNRMRHDLENNDYNRRVNSLPAEKRKQIKLYQTYHRLLSNENFEKALKEEAAKMTAELTRTCSNMASKDLLKKIVNIKCTRKLNKRTKVLEKFTKFLNIYADPKYPFDEELAGILLQKLEANLTFRYGEVDYNFILAYLGQALKYYRSQSYAYEARVIVLQSKHCLTLHKPGCFCRIGYVENEGECVKPEDCVTNLAVTEYLERIILF